ncbi:ABC transporter ATP-binding protein [Sulfolobales archaeon HS-7]|nr:ABC transporter ATP-binding protein [Sulfolobales archaeon HS-7]
MAFLELQHLTKTFYQKGKKVRVLDDVDLSVNRGEFVVVLGPSGEGKTTVLRIIAGLDQQDSGDIYIDGELVNDLPPKDRNVAMVFQNYAIYPFMTVFDNIAFPLKLRHVPKNEIREKVKKVSEMLQIDHLLDRKPYQLSGGQRQRVAIARALVKEARLLLMDEPLANLDAQLRTIAREELKELHKNLDITIMYVTHDQIEAMALGDKLAVLHNGVIQAYGTPMEIYKNPVNVWVASFIGNPPTNLLKGRIEGGNFVFEGYKLAVPKRIAEVFEGKEVIVGVRPDDIDIGGEIKGTIEASEPTGIYTIEHVKVGSTLIRVIDRGLIIRGRGQELKISINLDTAQFFDSASGRNLVS